MGFFSEFKKAASGEEAGDVYQVAGIQVTCSHCGNTHFLEQEALLDGRMSSLLGVEAFGKGATALVCTTCGHVEWFANQQLVERR